MLCLSSGMLGRVVWYILTDVSDVLTIWNTAAFMPNPHTWNLNFVNGRELHSWRFPKRNSPGEDSPPCHFRAETHVLLHEKILSLSDFNKN